MLQLNSNNKSVLRKENLAEIFYSGCKMNELTGVESEKLLVYKNTHKAVSYEDIVKVLECFSVKEWERVYENGNLIGLKGKTGAVTLEPGSQIELSLNPEKTLDEIVKQLALFYSNLQLYAEKIGAEVLHCGIQPVSTYKDIKIIPKKRYEFMTKYLPLKGSEPFIMMRETAGIQVNIDYKSEKDAVSKLSLALKMSPLISAFYSASPVRNGRLTGLKSNRAASWLKVDEARCGLISRKLIEHPDDFSFDDYIEILLDIPMIFIERSGLYTGSVQTFREFMRCGLNGAAAEILDWHNHLSLYFPDVRLKSYIEIRNHDAQTPEMTYTAPAFWNGIMYNDEAAAEVEKILSKYSYEDFMQLRSDAPASGIDAKLGRLRIIDLIKEFFDISYQSLREKGSEKYLEPAFEFISMKRVPADSLIDEYQRKHSS